jgi:hypothetical protein
MQFLFEIGSYSKEAQALIYRHCIAGEEYDGILSKKDPLKW